MSRRGKLAYIPSSICELLSPVPSVAGWALPVLQKTWPRTVLQLCLLRLQVSYRVRHNPKSQGRDPSAPCGVMRPLWTTVGEGPLAGPGGGAEQAG